jgi:hypothetical protein
MNISIVVASAPLVANGSFRSANFRNSLSDPRTQAYVTRRTEEGLTKGEIIRMLKRYVAREVYRYLKRP